MSKILPKKTPSLLMVYLDISCYFPFSFICFVAKFGGKEGLCDYINLVKSYSSELPMGTVSSNISIQIEFN